LTLVPGTPIGKYLVHRKLAEGGMAELYLCSSLGPEGFEKEVVIKRIRPFLSSDPEFVRMFIAEARLASRLNHPNLVQIFDFDKHQDSYYLAMEHVRGHSLSELRKRCKARMVAIPPTLVAHIGAEVARGLHHAHRLTENGCPLGLVHRDVTPHNVLLSFDGAVKLTDFGIAKASDRLTSPGRLKGKLAYMSPEQSRGERVDARTDVFALGIVLWEMMTGGRLFEGDSDMAVLQAVRGSAIPSVARLNPDVPLDLDGAVMKALARKPELRHQSAQEFERALAQCVLQNARTLEDTDVAGFVRMLFADECSSPASRASQPVAPGIGVGTDRNRRQSETSATSVSAGVLLDIEGCPASPMPEGARQRIAHRRLALKLSLGAAALVALAATPRLHLAQRQRSSPSGVSATGEHQIEAVDSAQIQSVPPDRRIAEPGSPTFSRAGGAALAQSPEDLQTGHGILVLKIAPWAFLSIDGRSKGEVSGIRRYRLAAGKHRLRLWHPRGSKEVEVLLREGERLVEEYQVFSRLH
jgi:serine/threonine protein kinase